MVLNDYGLIFVRSWALSALAVHNSDHELALDTRADDAVVQPRHSHDWGNLTLRLVMLWTYFAFSQYLADMVGQLAGRDDVVCSAQTRRLGRDRS
jgi:hypothetical protein